MPSTKRKKPHSLGAPSRKSPRLASSPKREPIVIGVYSFKGGTAKTTTTLNVAAALANPDGPNLKVCMIDMDPQANLTMHFEDGLDIQQDQVEETMEVASALANLSNPLDEDQLFKGLESHHIPLIESYITKQNDKPTVWNIYSAAAHGRIYKNSDPNKKSCESMLDGLTADNVTKINEDDPLSWSALKVCNNTPLYQDDPNNFNVFKGNLLLLRGSNKLKMISEIQSEVISKIDDVENGSRFSRSIQSVGLLRWMTRQINENQNVDVFLVDMNPDPGPFNKMICMSMDYILPVCVADAYSVQSAYNFTMDLLPYWQGFHKTVKTNQERSISEDGEDAETAFFLQENPPKILPFVINNYEMAADGNVVLDASLLIGSLREFLNSQPSKIPTNIEFKPFGTHKCILLLHHLESGVGLCGIWGNTFIELVKMKDQITAYYDGDTILSKLPEMEVKEIRKELQRRRIIFNKRVKKEKLIELYTTSRSEVQEKKFLKSVFDNIEHAANRYKYFAERLLDTVLPEIQGHASSSSSSSSSV